MQETGIETYLINQVNKLRGLVIKLGKNGFPDRLVILPGKVLLFIELKAPGKKARALQKKRQRQLRALGQESLIIDSKQDIKELIRRYKQCNSNHMTIKKSQ